MKKYMRKHLKDQKRILKLMYQKGVLQKLNINIKHIGWDFLLNGKKGRKRKGVPYGFSDWLPELYVFSSDYSGEWDSNSLVGLYKDALWWEFAYEFDDMGFPSKYITFNDASLIKHLSKMPTINPNSKFNIFLKVNTQ